MMRGVLLTVAALLLWPVVAVAQTGQVIEYYHTDTLGSVRAVTKVVNGQMDVVTHDFMPFGEEVNEPSPPKGKRLFTGKERDRESRLDYFGARYLASDVARFTTVDPDNASASPNDPQSWNTYAYVRNNPLKYIDPDGRRWFTKNGNAVWIDPNKDGTYTSPGEGWVEVGPTSEYNGRLNVAFVNGELSYIGETDKGGKMLTPFFREEPIQDASCGLAANVYFTVTGVRAVAGALAGARTVTDVAVATAKGARYPNLAANLTAREFQANLLSSGFRIIKQTVGPNGPVTVLSNGQKIYTIYRASSTGGASVQVANAAGQILSKIRLSGF